MRYLLPLLALGALLTGVAADLMLSDSFEQPGKVRWQKTWGPSEASADRAQRGEKSLKQTLEGKYGLAVTYYPLPGYPRTVYRASAFVYVPSAGKTAAPCLAFTRPDWSPLATATTAEKDKWVELKVEYTITSERSVNLALYQVGQTAGLGGAVMYWDDVRVERQLGETKMTDGIRINPYVVEGLDVTPAGGMRLKVAPGKIDVEGTTVTVGAETVLEVASPRLIAVRDEKARLTDEEPKSYHGGTALRGCTIEGIGLAGALVPESLVVKAAAGPAGRRLVEGKDWRADKAWGRVGRLEGGEIKADTDVYLDYDFGLIRVDTVVVQSDGKVVLRTGAEDKTIPAPPTPDLYSRPLCNLYLPCNTRELKAELIYPLGPPYPAASEEEIAAKAALIPGTLEKLQSGCNFSLVFWGDSVTCGGTASSPDKAFPQAFTAWLRNRYPQANIHYVNAGTGGWNSDGKLPLLQKEVLDHKPDLVVIEFVNDMGMSREKIFANYTEAVGKIRAQGGEVIILTPHFTRPDWMGAGDNMRTPEIRAAVTFLREFAAENKVGLADASRRWEHLWVEGLPYLTLENNAINHPDDRGHRLFVEELQKFFPAPDEEAAKDLRRCSFCGRMKPTQVKDLIAGSNGVCICPDCVELCNQVLKGRAEKPPAQ